MISAVAGALAGADLGAGALTLLAVVQGLTEFLPISSSGHLVLAQHALGLERPALAVDVALHVGTLLAVVLVYRKDLAQLVVGLAGGRWREPLLLLLATVPAALIGILFKSSFEEAFGSLRSAGCGLLVTAVALAVGDRGRRRLAPGTEPRFGWKQALLIGLAQAVAIWPGISRSGMTITTGMLCGLSPARAARFSFLMSIPAILGAAVLELPEAVENGVAGGWGVLAWACVCAALVGWGALWILLTFLGRGVFAWFAGYCAILGGATLLVS